MARICAKMESSSFLVKQITRVAPTDKPHLINEIVPLLIWKGKGQMANVYTIIYAAIIVHIACAAEHVTLRLGLLIPFVPKVLSEPLDAILEYI